MELQIKKIGFAQYKELLVLIASALPYLFLPGEVRNAIPQQGQNTPL
jgi:hypothetical protein